MAGRRLITILATTPGCKSFVAWIPDRTASMVILANDEDVSIEDLMSQLLPAALEP